MFSVGQNGPTQLLPNAKRRKINLQLDSLSARNFRKLRYNLTRKLTEMGSTKFIGPMVESSDQFTCQHDLFHETCMHHQDCVWHTKYGCFLHPLQVLLHWKQINGDTVKSQM